MTEAAVSMRGGLVVAFTADAPEPRLVFLPANVVDRLAAVARVTPVPGLAPPALGIALAEGELVTVLDIGHVGGAETPPDPPMFSSRRRGHRRTPVFSRGSQSPLSSG